jgi:hypothetical protein
MPIVEFFIATKESKRFKKGQKVWIRYNYGNHLDIWFRWRKKGRYIQGTIDKLSPCVGKIQSIEVNDFLANRVKGDDYTINHKRRKT